jgi:hypothetical protein
VGAPAGRRSIVRATAVARASPATSSPLPSRFRLPSRQFAGPQFGASAIAVAGVIAVASALGAIGADSRWLAALGKEIIATGGVPEGVPYASAPSSGWPNVLVLAEILFHAFDTFGERGFLAAQVIAVGVGFSLLALDARRAGASDAGTALVLLLVLVGAFTSIVVVRLQLFSIALFPLALLLLRDETRRPSRRIWLLVPLVALWGNLHGGVLIGLAVASAFLLFERAPKEPLVALGVWCGCVLGLLATPEFTDTVDYYRGVLSNEAAERGVGLWEPLDLRSGVDLLLLATAVALLVLAARARPRLWESVALVALALLTIRTARSGVWLLFVAAAPAACALPLVRTPRPRVAAAVAAALVAVTIAGLARGPVPTGASSRVLDAALAAADGTPILAEGVLAEQIVLDGGRVWVANPLDAFRRDDQRVYVDWIEGLESGDRALAHARVIVVRTDGKPAERIQHQRLLRELARDGSAVVYSRTR